MFIKNSFILILIFSADEVEESESQELRLFLTRESPEEHVIWARKIL